MSLAFSSTAIFSLQANATTLSRWVRSNYIVFYPIRELPHDEPRPNAIHVWLASSDVTRSGVTGPGGAVIYSDHRTSSGSFITKHMNDSVIVALAGAFKSPIKVSLLSPFKPYF